MIHKQMKGTRKYTKKIYFIYRLLYFKQPGQNVTVAPTSGVDT